jgi:HlyD family secretion protein
MNQPPVPPSKGKLAPRLLISLLTALISSACAPPPRQYFQGYIEAEYVYASSQLAGTLETLNVSRGQSVLPGSQLYTLERSAELATQREYASRLAQARARLDDLQKGRRPTEIASLEAELEHARQSLKLAQSELDRRVELISRDVIAVEEFDRAQTQRDLEHARVQQALADLDTARLGARVDEIKAAAAEVEAFAAAHDRAQWAVDQKAVSAPTNAFVHDTLYRPGEWVAAGYPVVVLLPPANLKVRFFVQQHYLPALRTGMTISVSADGASDPYPATISYLSTQAEFTPPVIYSRDTRSKLIYLVEAIFPAEISQSLRPGQPVDVRLP